MKLDYLTEDYSKWATKGNVRGRRRLSRSTIRRYNKVVKNLLTDLGHPSTVTEEEFSEWFRDATAEVSASTSNVKTAAITSFLAYLRETDTYLKFDPENLDLRYATVKQGLPRPADTVVYDRMIAEVEKESESVHKLQDYLYLNLMFHSSLRRQEVANLLVGNVEDKDSLRLIGKGDKERVTILSDEAYSRIVEWAVNHRNPEDKEVDELRKASKMEEAFSLLRSRYPDLPLFVSSRGTPLVEHYDPGVHVYNRFRRYLRKLPEEYHNITPHQFRHSYATNLLNAGADSLLISRTMGHSDPRMMNTYAQVAKVGLRDLKSKMARSNS